VTATAASAAIAITTAPTVLLPRPMKLRAVRGKLSPTVDDATPYGIRARSPHTVCCAGGPPGHVSRRSVVTATDSTSSAEQVRV